MKRSVFFVSDGTAITAETLGHSLLTQFRGITFAEARLPFVDNAEKAEQAKTRIDRAADNDQATPLVFSTIVDPQLVAILHQSRGKVMDLFGLFLDPLEGVLGVGRSPRVGRAHGIGNAARYEHRIEATNYALAHDDGVKVDFEQAEVILIGVSRSGKTPTCLYLALHFGVNAANYPFTEDDLAHDTLPEFLRRHRPKLYGLTIDPARLAQIREMRRPHSRYASLAQCRREVKAAEVLFKRENIPMLNTTHTSIEEIASRILQDLGLEKRFF